MTWCLLGCRERRRLREMAGLDEGDTDGEDAQVGRCSSRAANAEDVCPAAADGYAVRSAHHAVLREYGYAFCLCVMLCLGTASLDAIVT